MPETTDNSIGANLGFPLKGTLRRSPFPKLVRQLARTKSTGSLYLLNGKTKKVVFFDHGEPISVRSNVTAECLGQILAREGLITQAQCDQTLESIRRTGKKQGELLIEMGILSEGNLRYGLHAQLRHKLFDIFGWDDGRYQYKPDIKGDDYGLRFDTDAQALILSALLETAEEPRALKALEPYVERFPVIDPNHGVPLEVTPEEDYFLACLDGSRSIGELLETPADPVVPSTALLLYASIQAGIAKLAKTRRQPRERPPKPEDGRVKPDRELTPDYEPRLTVTTYEDTPLPGQLPKPPDNELDDFAVDDGEVVQAHSREISSALVAAERDTPDETFDEDLELSEAEAPGEEPDEAHPLVADPAESGVFERVLLDDDDDKPFGEAEDDEPPTVDALPAPLSGAQAEPPPLELPAEPDPTLELDGLPPGVEPPPNQVVAQAATLPATLPEEEIEEIEEIEELEELEEIEELDDAPVATGAPAPASAAAPVAAGGLAAAVTAEVPSQRPRDHTPDTGVPRSESAPAPVNGDELAALAADLEVDDDLALDDSLDAALDVLEGDLPLDETTGDDETASADELVGLDELDDIDLGLDYDPDATAEATAEADDDPDYDPDATAEADDETLGALQFSDGETATAEQRWPEAIAHFEAAYEHGIDVAELHTMLAWARFQASGEAPEMAEHALELLAYAEEMNPNLAMVHAYRSAVLLAQGDSSGAQDAAQRALDIDPYDELAIDVMDKLV